MTVTNHDFDFKVWRISLLIACHHAFTSFKFYIHKLYFKVMPDRCRYICGFEFQNSSQWVALHLLSHASLWSSVRTGHFVSVSLIITSLSSDRLFATEWPLGFMLLIKLKQQLWRLWRWVQMGRAVGMADCIFLTTQTSWKKATSFKGTVSEYSLCFSVDWAFWYFHSIYIAPSLL